MTFNSTQHDGSRRSCASKGMCDFFETLCLDKIDHSFWGVLLEIILFLYAFGGLAIVCDEYLVVSLETFCVRFNVREVRAVPTHVAALGYLFAQVLSLRIAGTDSATARSPHLTVLCVHTSLRSWCVALQDIAGASFMAFGSAAPEIIINAIATIQSTTSGDEDANATNLGVSAIIG